MKLIALAVLTASTLVARGQVEQAAAPTFVRRLDVVVPRILDAMGAPGASVVVVRDGSIVLTRTWGLARVEPRVVLTPGMRFAIGSTAKQFCAAALLLLQQDRKLSLDDRVARHLPGVAHGEEVSIRQLLNHTAGYDDYWPQDYVPDYLFERADVPRIMREWGGRPLTSTPGTEFRYSNTNYVIAAAIVERASGMPYFEFLQKRIFGPLGMKSAFDYTSKPLPSADAAGYFRYALGPARAAPREAGDWLFGAGNLAMTASDLALWDLSVISRTLLSEASYAELETEARRTDGTRAQQYGLGVELSPRAGRRAVWHSGGGSGFTSTNFVFPAERAAVVVLANGKGRVTFDIAEFIARTLFAAGPLPDEPQELPRPAPPPIARMSSGRPEVMRAKAIFENLQKGVLDRSTFTEGGNAYFTKQALADYAASLAPLGAPASLWPIFEAKRGALTVRGFQVWFPTATLSVTTMELADGRLEQYFVSASPPVFR